MQLLAQAQHRRRELRLVRQVDVLENAEGVGLVALVLCSGSVSDFFLIKKRPRVLSRNLEKADKEHAARTE